MVSLFEKANNSFLKRESSLLDSGVSERTLCGALAQCIDNLICNDGSYDGYHVDVEYNRNNDGRIKTIINDEMEVLKINCDLILHSRGEHADQDNLIALEMKKAYRSKSEKNKDRNRLIALTKSRDDNVWSYDGKVFPKNVCGYVLGVYYEIDEKRGTALIEYYQRGEMLDLRTMQI